MMDNEVAILSFSSHRSDVGQRIWSSCGLCNLVNDLFRSDKGLIQGHAVMGKS